MTFRLNHLFRNLVPDTKTAALRNDAGADLAEQGRIQDALQQFMMALEADPKSAEAWSNIGSCYHHLDRPGEACKAYQSAESLGFRDARLYDNWGNALGQLGQLEDAEKKFRLALELAPNLAEAKASLGLCLTTMGMVEEGLELTQEAWAQRPDDPGFASMALFAAQYSGNLTAQHLLAGHRRWPQANVDIPYQHRNTPDPDRKLRIGYVSPDFRVHSCACFLLPVLETHDKNEVSVIGYSSSPKSDFVTDKVRASVDTWVDISALAGRALVDRIRADEIDILIDCVGHTKGNRLLEFTQRPAPIQITWLGYPSTTGLNAMDFRISDEVADPVGDSDKWHSETVLRLPQGFHTFRPLVDTPDVSLSPCDASGVFTFGAFHNLAKVSDDAIRLWSKVLNAVPHSKLLLKSRGLSGEKVSREVRRRFANEGVSQDQLIFSEWHPAYGAHFQDYSKVDAILDSTPYNGTTTTCEALWMGVPVLALKGVRTASRVGASLLTQVGHTEWIAASADDFVSIAKKLAGDRARINGIRQSLRQTMMQTPLGNARTFTAELESTYREIWQRWCAQHER